MKRNSLPGQPQPYVLESGEGQRYLLGRFLATIINRSQDTGSLISKFLAEQPPSPSGSE